MTDLFIYQLAISIHIITAFYEFIIWKGNRLSPSYTKEDGQIRHHTLFVLLAYVFIPYGALMNYNIEDFIYYLTVVTTGRILFFNIIYNYLRKREGNNTPILYFSPTYFFLDKILHDNPKVGYVIVFLIFSLASYLLLVL